MNTRVIASRTWEVAKQAPIALSRPMLWTVVLLIAVFFSAFSVVYTKDLHRRLFIQYQNLQQDKAQAISRFSKLLLEQSTWSTQSRVQRIARDDLGMQLPSAKDIVLVTDDH